MQKSKYAWSADLKVHISAIIFKVKPIIRYFLTHTHARGMADAFY